MPSRVFAFVQTTLKKNPALSYAELKKIAKRKGYNVPTVIYNRAMHLAGAVHRHTFSAREKEWLLSVRCPKSEKEDKDYHRSLAQNFNKQFGLNLSETEVVRACRNFHRIAMRGQTAKYTPEEDQYILELREKGLSYKDVAKLFNKCFGAERSCRGLQQRGFRLALTSKGLTLPPPATNGVVYVVTIDGKVVHRGPKKPEVAISREQEIARL